MLTVPGEVYDVKGVPIYPGDLLRSFHFRARRRNQVFYLYHAAVWNAEEQTMEMIPASHLEPSKRNGGGRCWLTQRMVDDNWTEVIDGCGPGDCLDWTERKKRQVVAV